MPDAATLSASFGVGFSTGVVVYALVFGASALFQLLRSL